jgi:hypothetical protein
LSIVVQYELPLRQGHEADHLHPLRISVVQLYLLHYSAERTGWNRKIIHFHISRWTGLVKKADKDQKSTEM